VLPQDSGWYPAPAVGKEFRIVVTQGDVVTEHVIRSLDISSRAGSASLAEWLKRTKGSEQVASSAIESDVNDVYDRAKIYRSAALKLALAKEPVRGGPGAAIFRTAAPAVVFIQTDTGSGSGIVISKKGEVLTNWHVINGAKFIAIHTKPPAGQRLNPSDVYEAILLRYDQVADLALIQFQRAPPNLALLRTGDERGIEVGSSVHAIGHPLGQDWTYTQGVISQVRTDYRWQDKACLQHAATVIQTQTPINPGNSGGPLLSDDVAVIGVNAFVKPETQGLNYAIALQEIKQFLARSGNRECPNQTASPAAPAKPDCKARQFPPIIDPVTKKDVTPIDTLCLGKPNAWQVGKPPEYLLFDRVGDGKIDFKIVYNFAPNVDLYIMYERRDEVPTLFGYDYGKKGKPDRWVNVGPPHQ
jgi:S1-C subfamily serine protease